MGNDITARPIEHLRAWTHHYPALPGLIDQMRRDRGTALPDWPEWCFIPLAGWIAMLMQDPDYEGSEFAAAADVGRVAALGTWRYSQGVYVMDPALRAALTETDITGELPSEVFLRLPEWCVYVATPGMAYGSTDLHGFWAHLEHDANDGRAELRLVLDTDTGLVAIPIHLGQWTLVEAMQRVIAEASRQVPGSPLPDRSTELAETLNPIVSILLYLCSEEPEIDNDRHPGVSPAYASPTKTKRGWRLFPPDQVTVWQVGRDVGDTLRHERQTVNHDTGRTMRPHIRRGHWHGYWRGSRDGDREFVYHWLPPQMVANPE